MKTIFDSAVARFDTGALVPNATVTVTDLNGGGGNAELFSDRDGLVSISNPTTADSDGRVVFYAEPGRYDIVASFSGGSVTYNDVILSESGGQILLNNVPSSTPAANTPLFGLDTNGNLIQFEASELGDSQAKTDLTKTSFDNGNLFAVVDHLDSNNLKGITPTNLFPNKATPVPADRYVLLDSQDNDLPKSTTVAPGQYVEIAEPDHTDHTFSNFDVWDDTSALANGQADKVNRIKILMPQGTDNTQLWIAGANDTRNTGAGVDGQLAGVVTSGSIGNYMTVDVTLDSLSRLKVRCNNRVITIKLIVIGYLN